MDILADIKERTASIATHPSAEGIRAVIRHIERAERHLAEGRRSGDDDAFNDVIYRTNQAFEGSLKEVYRVLEGANAKRLNPHQIEQSLLDRKVLVPRVVDLLKNYRQQWRNPSTHDHCLSFGDQEAFLAIVSVSAFVSVLVDQLVEAIHYHREREEAERRQKRILEVLGDYEEASFDEQVVALLLAFDEERKHKRGSEAPNAEFEILGQLGGFLETIGPTISVQREPVLLKHDLHYRPDIVLTRGDQSVVVEVKRVIRNWTALQGAFDQVENYITAGGWNAGVIYAPTGADTKAVTHACTYEMRNFRFKIHAVYPELASEELD